MKIVVLEGSPNKNGSTHILADCFRQGAEGAGHTVEMIDVAHAESTRAPAASTAATKGYVCRRTMWRTSGGRFWTQICWCLPRRSTTTGCPPS